MSRSGYTDDCDDQWAVIRWRGAVKSAIKGKRGQALLVELLAALDAMPEKRLIVNELEENGEHCTLGVLGAKRGVDMKSIDVYDYRQVANAFNASQALVQEIEYENDEGSECSIRRGQQCATPEDRWQYMRDWVAKKIITASASPSASN